MNAARALTALLAVLAVVCSACSAGGPTPAAPTGLPTATTPAESTAPAATGAPSPPPALTGARTPLPTAPPPTALPPTQTARPAAAASPEGRPGAGVKPAPTPPLPFFGVSMGPLTVENGLLQAQEAGVRLVRRGAVRWRDVEPVRTDPPTYRWEALERLDRELILAREAGLEVDLLVMYTPAWAQRVPGHSCGAIKEESLDEFAQFLRAAVERYSRPPYEVRLWELFNEPDVDPSLVPPDAGFGCWGDEADPYYGGRTYGRMLLHAYPAVKSADPSALVILGGLLLDAPNTLPSAFLDGVLQAGAGDAFDILAYHAYTFYSPDHYDWDSLPGRPWVEWGGVVAGKAAFLRQVLGRYGAAKPLMLNEAGLAWLGSEEPSDGYRRAQADYLVRLCAQARALDLASVAWYGWRAPGWRRLELLDEDLSPLPAYHALPFVLRQLEEAAYTGALDLPGVVGYAFEREGLPLQVLWSRDGQPHPVPFVADRFVGAWGPAGEPVEPEPAGGQVVLSVLEPVFVELLP